MSTTPTPKKGFDPSSFISLGFDLIGGTLMGISEGKKNRELAEKLQKLSLKQQRELEERLQDTQLESDRQRLMYEAVAVVEKSKLIDSQKTKQKILLGVLGMGVIVLVGMAIVFKRK